MKMQNGVDLQKDRRVFERIPVNLPVKLLDLTSKQEIDAHTRDVSADGLGIVSRQPLKSGDTLRLWLEMPDKGEPFYTKGKVVWMERQKISEYRSGISLEKVELMGMSRIFNDNYRKC